MIDVTTNYCSTPETSKKNAPPKHFNYDFSFSFYFYIWKNLVVNSFEFYILLLGFYLIKISMGHFAINSLSYCNSIFQGPYLKGGRQRERKV